VHFSLRQEESQLPHVFENVFIKGGMQKQESKLPFPKEF
jgi:hypothetical protein